MLSLYYQDDPTREREVALYIDGKYVTRGPASNAVLPANWGFKAIYEVVPPGRLHFELDTNGPGRRDVPNLCWGNERISAEAFLRWYDSAR